MHCFRYEQNWVWRYEERLSESRVEFCVNVKEKKNPCLTFPASQFPIIFPNLNSKVCIIRLVHIFEKKSSSTFWQVRSCQRYEEDFFKVAFSENPNFNCFNLLDLRNLQEQVKKAFCLKFIYSEKATKILRSGLLRIYVCTLTKHLPRVSSDSKLWGL